MFITCEDGSCRVGKRLYVHASVHMRMQAASSGFHVFVCLQHYVDKIHLLTDGLQSLS